MSLFSENIIEDPWVGMAYSFWNCTNPAYQSDVWKDAFKLNWSRSKMKKLTSQVNNGTTRFSKQDFDELKETLERHVCRISIEYYYIIVLILTSPALDEKTITDILTSCLIKQPYNHVEVKIRFGKMEHVYIILHVHTVTPQRIEIVLKKK